MHIVLDVPQQLDMDWLLKLFQQLNLRVVQKTEAFPETETTVFAPLSGPGLPENSVRPELWASIVRPIRQSQSIEEMIAEQNYKGFDRAEFDRLVDAIDLQDPDGELFKLLGP